MLSFDLKSINLKLKAINDVEIKKDTSQANKFLSLDGTYKELTPSGSDTGSGILTIKTTEHIAGTDDYSIYVDVLIGTGFDRMSSTIMKYVDSVIDTTVHLNIDSLTKPLYEFKSLDGVVANTTNLELSNTITLTSDTDFDLSTLSKYGDWNLV